MPGRTRLRAPDRWLDRNQRPLAAVALVLVVFVLACIVLSKITTLFPQVGELDPGLKRYQLSPTSRHVLDAIIFPSRPPVAALTVVLLAAVAWRQGGWPAAALAPAVAGAAVVAAVAKRVPPDSSLPSGHAAYAVATFGLAGWLCLRVRRPGIALALAVLALATGPAKVALATHFPIDVVVGDALGLGWLLGVLLISHRLRLRARERDGGFRG